MDKNAFMAVRHRLFTAQRFYHYLQCIPFLGYQRAIFRQALAHPFQSIFRCFASFSGSADQSPAFLPKAQTPGIPLGIHPTRSER